MGSSLTCESPREVNHHEPPLVTRLKAMPVDFQDEKGIEATILSLHEKLITEVEKLEPNMKELHQMYGNYTRRSRKVIERVLIKYNNLLKLISGFGLSRKTLVLDAIRILSNPDCTKEGFSKAKDIIFAISESEGKINSSAILTQLNELITFCANESAKLCTKTTTQRISTVLKSIALVGTTAAFIVFILPFSAQAVFGAGVVASCASLIYYWDDLKSIPESTEDAGSYLRSVRDHLVKLQKAVCHSEDYMTSAMIAAREKDIRHVLEKLDSLNKRFNELLCLVDKQIFIGPQDNPSTSCFS